LRYLYEKGFYTPPSSNSNYLRSEFIQHIVRDEIEIIFELGSLHAIDALLLNKFYNARVFAFECNPSSIRACRRRLRHVDRDQVTLVQKAVWRENARIPFYPVVGYYERGDSRKRHNPGASSCYRDIGTFHERYVQREIQVEAIRLDDFCKENKITKIGLVCMDVQGAMLEALLGLGDMLSNVHYMISEISTSPIYTGEACYDEVYQYLKGFDFEMISYHSHLTDAGELEPFADYLFVNKSFSKY